MAHIERRVRRSNDQSEALFYQLEACRVRSELSAMILADSEGLCVAAAGDARLCDEMAAHMALVCERTPSFDGAVLAPTERFDVLMQRVDIDETPLFLCAVGGQPEQRIWEVDRCQGGVPRILAA